MGGQRRHPQKAGYIFNLHETTWAKWTDILAVAQRAEEVGFGSLWVPDHLLGVWEGKVEAGYWEKYVDALCFRGGQTH